MFSTIYFLNTTNTKLRNAVHMNSQNVDSIVIQVRIDQK